jgi:uncharacterized membrane protein
LIVSSRNLRTLLFSALVVCLLFVGSQPVRSETPTPVPIVHAVLFISPTCRHCQQVLTNVLPSISEEYGDRLEVVIFDINFPDGRSLFLAAVQMYAVPSSVVPLLIVGDAYLLGTVDIRKKFPDTLDRYLALGGVDLPALPGLQEALHSLQETQAFETPQASPTASTPPSPAPGYGSGCNILPVATPTVISPGFADRVQQDPVGNVLALFVLAGLILSIPLGAWVLLRGGNLSRRRQIPWLIPLLCFAGLVVAGYLAYVETAQVEAYCGVVGDCNTVQQSEYARLFGFLPIGVLGMAGYLAILATWLVSRRARGRLAAFATLVQLAQAAFGVLFSIWLTCLELFVIGAVCAWCLLSAVLMTALFLACLGPGKAALQSLKDRPASVDGQ